VHVLHRFEYTVSFMNNWQSKCFQKVNGSFLLAVSRFSSSVFEIVMWRKEFL
jgi:hypothetical protein